MGVNAARFFRRGALQICDAQGFRLSNVDLGTASSETSPTERLLGKVDAAVRGYFTPRSGEFLLQQASSKNGPRSSPSGRRACQARRRGQSPEVSTWSRADLDAPLAGGRLPSPQDRASQGIAAVTLAFARPLKRSPRSSGTSICENRCARKWRWWRCAGGLGAQGVRLASREPVQPASRPLDLHGSSDYETRRPC